MKLDELIENTKMTYRERLELAIGDSRGNFKLTPELKMVEGATEYAKERISFWTTWNEEYQKKFKKLNTQKRFIDAQIASEVYANAVYKSLESMFVLKILHSVKNSPADSFLLFKELLLIYSGGSYLMMKSIKKTVLNVIRQIKQQNALIGVYFEVNLKNIDEVSIKKWIKTE